LVSMAMAVEGVHALSFRARSQELSMPRSD